MVGWSRRSAESSASSRRHREWFNSLPPEEQEKIRQEEAERYKRNRPGLIAALIFGFLVMFVGWPLAAYQMANMRWKAQWDGGKLISNDGKTICKEVEYCAPCSPIHHWHKKVFCEPVGK